LSLMTKAGAADAQFVQMLLAQNDVNVEVVVLPVDLSGGLAVRLTCHIFNDSDDIQHLGETVLLLANTRPPAEGDW
jgi:hypothetical protein